MERNNNQHIRQRRRNKGINQKQVFVLIFLLLILALFSYIAFSAFFGSDNTEPEQEPGLNAPDNGSIIIEDPPPGDETEPNNTQESDDPQESDDIDKIKLAEAQIHGNLGAYNLAKHRATNDLAWVNKAISSHLEGLKIRKSVFDKSPGSDKEDDLMGKSYNCLATDYFMLGDYEQSLDNHREAIRFRENGNTKDIRLVESYTRCIGTLNKLLSCENQNLKSYLDEVISLYSKALEYQDGKLKYKACFLINREELKRIKDRGLETIKFIIANPDIANTDCIVKMREIASIIDTLCAEVSVESDLVSQFK